MSQKYQKKILCNKVFSKKPNWSLRKNGPNKEFFLVRISPYSAEIRENTDQKKLRIWTLFLQSEINQNKVHLVYRTIRTGEMFGRWNENFQFVGYQGKFASGF